MCGEHQNASRLSHGPLGSSPHVRGARCFATVFLDGFGIIPACAGSTCPSRPSAATAGDHPRMCGEHRICCQSCKISTGSSPHVRGALVQDFLQGLSTGIIPACAGSTVSWRIRRPPCRDHPRMCGEHCHCNPIRPRKGGSSPHVRGARDDAIIDYPGPGIIPACAGSTSCCLSAIVFVGDHPRMCGEHTGSKHVGLSYTGSSPHVRGALDELVQQIRCRGIIPACAGSTRLSPNVTECHRDHPRMCGEHRSSPILAWGRWGSSPHVRGAHFENSIIPRKRKDNWLFFIQFRFENFLAFRYLLALLHPFLGVPTKDPSFASLGRLINCNPSQSTGDQSAPYTLKAICCSFLAE